MDCRVLTTSSRPCKSSLACSMVSRTQHAAAGSIYSPHTSVHVTPSMCPIHGIQRLEHRRRAQKPSRAAGKMAEDVSEAVCTTTNQTSLRSRPDRLILCSGVVNSPLYVRPRDVRRSAVARDEASYMMYAVSYDRALCGWKVLGRAQVAQRPAAHREVWSPARSSAVF